MPHHAGMASRHGESAQFPRLCLLVHRCSQHCAAQLVQVYGAGRLAFLQRRHFLTVRRLLILPFIARSGPHPTLRNYVF